MEYKNDIKKYIERVCDTLNSLDIEALNISMSEIVSAYKREANIYIFGNGGSAATASHFVCDFNKGISEGRSRKFRFVCLNDNIPTIMAIANDIDFDDIFEYQLRGRLKKEDLIIAISGSGNSRNVIKAVEYAKSCGADVIGLTGYDGGMLSILSDYHMHVDINDMQVVEDIHMIFDHMMMKIFCEKL